MNSFDGVVTILGVLVGALTTSVTDPEIILGISIGTIIGMMISGFSGAFIAEKTEREIDLERLKHSLLVDDLNDTIFAKAYKVTIWWVSIINAMSLFISGMIVIIPEILALYNLIDDYLAIYIAILIILIYLFILGSYLSKLSHKNPIKGGIILLLVGIGTTILIILILGG